jgi:hypothetical protein
MGKWLFERALTEGVVTGMGKVQFAASGFAANGFADGDQARDGSGMSKIIALVIIAMMAIQIIKPIGLPGFRQRRDFWKLAVVAFAAFALDVFLTHLA